MSVLPQCIFVFGTHRGQKKTLNHLGLELDLHALMLELVIRSMSSGRTANFLITRPFLHAPVLYFNLFVGVSGYFGEQVM